MTGGYKIISLQHTNFTTDGCSYTIPGVYEHVEGAEKAILFEHFAVDGFDMKPCYVNLAPNNTAFTGKLAETHSDTGIVSYYITIKDDDTVGITKV